jgi:hypothetical protein
MEIEQQSFTIQQFCVRNAISLSTFHKLRKAGRAPKLMSLGAAIRISIEAERDWHQAMANPPAAVAKRIKKEAQARVERTKRAGKLAVKSPKHVSKRRRGR